MTCCVKSTCQIWSLSFSIRHEHYERRYKMWKTGWFAVVRSHLRSLEIAPFNTAHKSFYLPSIVIISLSCTVSRYSEILVENRRCFTHPTCICRPCWGDNIRISWRSLVSEHWSPWAIVWRCLRDDKFSRFAMIPTCGGRADGRPNRHTRPQHIPR